MATTLDLIWVRINLEKEEYSLTFNVLEEATDRAKVALGISDHLDNDGDKIESTYQPTLMDLAQGGNWATRSELDTTIQGEISKYMDYNEWRTLLKSNEAFTTWPAPPPPPIEYHLIKFCLSDYYSGFVRFSKDFPSVVEAFNHWVRSNDENDGMGVIHIEFITIRDDTEPVIPLIHNTRAPSSVKLT